MSEGKTQIANLALNYIGEPPIMDLGDKDNMTARVINLLYKPTFRQVARDHEWNCLKRRVEAAKLAVNPVFGYEFQYQLPSDFIRMLRLNGRDIKDVTDAFEIEGLRLLTDADKAKIQYIADIDDTTQYDDLLIDAFAVLLAAKAATQIRQDEAKGDSLMQTYLKVALPRARKVDGNERNRSPYDAREQSRSIQSRRFGTLQGSLDADAV